MIVPQNKAMHLTITDCGEMARVSFYLESNCYAFWCKLQGEELVVSNDSKYLLNFVAARCEVSAVSLLLFVKKYMGKRGITHHFYVIDAEEQC